MNYDQMLKETNRLDKDLKHLIEEKKSLKLTTFEFQQDIKIAVERFVERFGDLL